MSQQQDQSRADVPTTTLTGKPLSAYMIKKKQKELEQQQQDMSFKVQQQLLQRQQPMQIQIQQPKQSQQAHNPLFTASSSFPSQALGGKPMVAQPLNQSAMTSQQQYRPTAAQGLQYPQQINPFSQGQMQYQAQHQVAVQQAAFQQQHQQQQQFNQPMQAQYVAQLPQQVGSNPYPQTQQTYYAIQAQQQQFQQQQQQQQRQPLPQPFIPQQQSTAPLQQRTAYNTGSMPSNPLANSATATQGTASALRQQQPPPRINPTQSNSFATSQNTGFSLFSTS